MGGDWRWLAPPTMPLVSLSPASAASSAGPLPAALAAQEVSHRYGETPVLHGVTLEVCGGEVVGLLGPSGSGKSTLLHLLGGLDVPEQGSVWWAGERADTLGTQQRAQRRAGRVGLIFQHHYLLEDLTLLQNVQVPAQLAGQGAQPERARALLERVGLGNRAGDYPGVLSGGERQRVAVARALMARPGVILADEPTGSLDRANADRVAGLLLELAREEGAGVLFVTHDERLAAQAHRTLELLDGRLV